MYNIRCYNNISEKGLSRLPASIKYSDSEPSAQDTQNTHGILLRSHKLQSSEIGENIFGIARAGAGTNNIPVEECAKRGIVVFNTPGANANSVKELVVCAMLLSSRKLSQSIRWLAELGTADPQKVEAGKKMFTGPEISGKTLGILGLGAIGSLVANAADALGMTVIGYDPFLSVRNALKLPKGIKLFEDINDVLRQSDYISLHLPLSPETKGLLKADNIGIIKEGARLINFARAGLVDETAVADALKTGRISHYVSDFPDQRFYGLEGAISFPHLGASTPEAEENCAIMACDQLTDFLLHGNIRNSVNYHDCELERDTEHRLTFSHENIPNMLGQISSTLAKEKLNIQEMMNRHCGDFAYTILDVDSAPTEKTLKELRAIPGILKLRYLT
ncbi:phosphoglycerate dehydrogenase [Candidatus Haliotispira prima]|uniref:D-3-phosphoglycerate dehydrogenase n=1 Tax=Candidatus Haliotispira prima TaxID=3034016 RepID=A0ABY8MIV9_9SPIO|nr:phosphoglycerate dehydrogenase [Candidatus Haliotispira prima]